VSSFIRSLLEKACFAFTFAVTTTSFALYLIALVLILFASLTFIASIALISLIRRLLKLSLRSSIVQSG